MPFPQEDDRTIIEPGATLKIPLQETRPYLEVLYPKEMRGSYPIEGETIIGRSREAQVCLDDDWISRRHCRLTYRAPSVEVEDLGSTNGTFIDGEQIEKARLSLESRLQLGQVIMKIEFKDVSEVRYDEELEKAATHDPLTGLPNRRWFEKKTLQALEDARESGNTLAVAMLDVDFFKKVNDTHGHQAGDFILKGIAETVREEFVAKNDAALAARFGGEEFILLLSNTSSRKAKKTFEAIRKAVEKNTFFYENKEIPITLSIGFASEKDSEIKELDSLVQRADEALYKAKEEGRNRVVGR